MASRWIALESALGRDEVVTLLSGTRMRAKRVRPRLVGSPVVLSVGDGQFTLRAYGFWRRYTVQGTIEPAETGSRVILEVAAAPRFQTLQAVSAAAVVATAVPILGFVVPHWAFFHDHRLVVWSGLAAALVLIAGITVSSLGTPEVKDRELSALKRSLGAFLEARSVT